MFTALVGAVVGAILGAYLTKRWTPNPASEITSLRQQVARFQERIDAFEAERAAQKQEDELWISKFESAASQVVKVGPALMMIRSPEGDSFMPYMVSFFLTLTRKPGLKNDGTYLAKVINSSASSLSTRQQGVLTGTYRNDAGQTVISIAVQN